MAIYSEFFPLKMVIFHMHLMGIKNQHTENDSSLGCAESMMKKIVVLTIDWGIDLAMLLLFGVSKKPSWNEVI